MGAVLPALDRQQFDARLCRCSPEELPATARAQLYSHFRELSRWNRAVTLVGRGRPEEFVERHWGESLAALLLLRGGERHLLDLGSGAGFPGLVLAAARPQLEVTLVEARQRKWAFLEAASRRAALPCRCLNARVGRTLPAGLPEEVDVVTSRALKLAPELLASVAARMSPEGIFLLWVGRASPPAPPGWGPGRSIPLPGSESRRIIELVRDSADGQVS